MTATESCKYSLKLKKESSFKGQNSSFEARGAPSRARAVNFPVNGEVRGVRESLTTYVGFSLAVLLLVGPQGTPNVEDLAPVNMPVILSKLAVVETPISMAPICTGLAVAQLLGQVVAQALNHGEVHATLVTQDQKIQSQQRISAHYKSQAGLRIASFIEDDD